MDVTLYKRPHSRTEVINITKIKDSDAAWFQDNNIPVSMEDCGMFYAVYADCGFRIDDDGDEDPDEIICTTVKGTCEVLMSELKMKCEKALLTERPRF